MNNLLDWYREYLKVMNKCFDAGLIDLGDYKFIDPEFLLLIFPLLNNKNIKYKNPVSQLCSNYIDFNLKNYNQVLSDTNTIPVSTLNDKNYNAILKEIFNIIEKNLKLPSNAKNLTGYMIGELFDNIEQHSGSSNNYLILQYYDKLGLEISIYDDGIGIPGDFKIHGIRKKDDSECLEEAISGISTKGEERGYGLNTINNIISSNKGVEFIIISGQGIYHYLNNSKSIYNVEEKYKFNGTLISIIFKDTEVLQNIDYLKYV
ncbi:ATP-binding protein [Ferroplasma sp.]|uniref:ATP-binding protein n=1 Tax=Ferroplasma sp. TaxID=2591003 RepID=UPI00307D2AE5